MNIISLILITLYRIWFYILVAIPIIVMLPLLVLTVLTEKTYPWFFALARIWAGFILYGMGCFPKIRSQEKMKEGKSYMLVANHSSMLDIMMMLVLTRNPFVFVGKKELASIPLFGFFYKRTCILVDRGNARSRKAVFDRATARLKSGMSICIFPEGGVTEDENDLLLPFKDGAFRLAIEHQIPIFPVVLYDSKKRFPFVYRKGMPGIMRAETLNSIETAGMTLQANKAALRDQVYQLILERLQNNTFSK